MKALEKKWNLYKEKAHLLVPYEDFECPKILIDIHRKNVGTVINHINSDLLHLDHMIYFGCMLFFKYLSINQLKDSPVVSKEMSGSVCAV